MDWFRDRRVIMVGAVALAAGLVAVVALVAAFGGDDGPRMCRITIGTEVIEYPCDSAGNRASASSDGGTWWASDTAQTIYAFLGFGVSGGAATWAWWRVRSRRTLFAAQMLHIDDTLAAHKAQPSEGGVALAAIRHELRAHFAARRLDDAHYLELDKRVTTALTKLRLLELDQRFRTLPIAFRSQITTLISDGSVSDAEVELVRGSHGAHMVPGRVHDEIVQMLGRWAAQDAGDSRRVDVQDPASDGAASGQVIVTLKEP